MSCDEVVFKPQWYEVLWCLHNKGCNRESDQAQH